MTRDELRRECHEDLAALRNTVLPERAFRLFEKLVARLDRIETGSFPPEDESTAPEVWSNLAVLEALREKKK